jgi:hypothetical protein
MLTLAAIQPKAPAPSGKLSQLSFLTKSFAASSFRYDKNSHHRYRSKKLENLMSVFAVFFF